MPRTQKSLLLGKLRQAYGANKLLCNRAGDEIVSLRKELDGALSLLRSIDAALRADSDSELPGALQRVLDDFLAHHTT